MDKGDCSKSLRGSARPLTRGGGPIGIGGCPTGPCLISKTSSLHSTASVAASPSDSLGRIAKYAMNPNKAIFTIDAKSSQILIVNNKACQLLGYSSSELCNMQFTELLTQKNKIYASALAEGQLNSEDGTMVLLSGKVIEMNAKSTEKIAVSLWIRQIDGCRRCLAVAEPVERRVCQMLIDAKGHILSADNDTSIIFQYECVEQIIGNDIKMLIPAILLPEDPNKILKNVRKQKATGKTEDGISFPLCLQLLLADSRDIINLSSSTKSAGNISKESNPLTTSMNISSTSGGADLISNSTSFYVITVWVFQNISGLIVINEFGLIESCNHHFSMLMFGYAQSKILNQHITKLIPNFGQDMEYMYSMRSRNATNSSLDNSETETANEELLMMDGCVNKNDKTEEYTNNVNEISKKLENVEVDGVANKVNSYQGNPDLVENVEKCLNQSSIKTSKITTPNTITTGVNNKKVLIENNCDLNSPFDVECSNLNCNENEKNFTAQKKIPNTGGDGGNDELLIDRSNVQSSKRVIQYHPPTDDLLTPVNEFSSLPYNVSDLVNSSSIIPESSRTPSRILLDCSTNSRTDENLMKYSALTTSTPFGYRNLQLPPPTTPTTAAINSANSNRISQDLTGNRLLEGSYKGIAIHSDGNSVQIFYTICAQTLPCGRKIFCVWICRDPDSMTTIGEEEDKHRNLTLTFNSIASTIEHSLGQAIRQTAAQNSSRPNSLSLISQCEDDQISGNFSKNYTVIKQVGRGAYGYVKLAYRNADRLLVFTKFILKDKLCPQLMVTTEDSKEIPMEIFLLTSLKHPNIVSVLDVFENEKFFQLVMEKHGSGMDLFEFIDRHPSVDEKLGSFIFRQIVNAVNYLHSLNVLHRDIKDENIIIDQHFHIKLIDFGSATFMEEGKLFSTFFGTTEYCSPEVLAGNKYAGPELEVWSLGVTLYVLMFFENPFLDAEETLKADLVIPHLVSSHLEDLLNGMLNKDPKARYTMKQLMIHPWVTQDVNSLNFNFAKIVPCEPHEANPEKYFSGHIYSSCTALSITSPQDSLSLVDEDSIIDGDEVVDYEEDKSSLNTTPQQQEHQQSEEI